MNDDTPTDPLINVSWLEAKRRVDDRSLHPRLFETVVDHLASDHAHRVLDVGAGTGAMLDRLLESGALRGRGKRLLWTALDPDPACAALLESRTASWAASGIDVLAVQAELSEIAAHRRPPVDLLVACALLDLLDIEEALVQFAQLLAGDGLLYMPIVFDGTTAFVPATGSPLDGELEAVYHASMDARAVGGGAQSGRRLLGAVLEHPHFELVDAAASSWVVRASDSRATNNFLRQLLAAVVREGLAAGLDHQQVTDWQRERQARIDEDRLAAVVHQLDVLARRL